MGLFGLCSIGLVELYVCDGLCVVFVGEVLWVWCSVMFCVVFYCFFLVVFLFLLKLCICV